ncbi:MAG: hypothetical protein KKF46_04300 [Nanoarchaeota archaeon]|nr:hypothetical protein [Nanoarchaeota archaeon]MBU1321557.1 hypothetical protein [Nanoarchaeota archaeon]MBU1597091.1 hypothetical protein [Nanoarchaeota archaeon]MBU2441872.1 hypothetical protein [Nanoarchaeota archaeon]
MDLERKIELMKKYDFLDYRNKLSGIMALLDILSRGKSPKEKSEKYLKLIRGSYEWIHDKYNSIDFDELENEIETEQDKADFQTLFISKPLIPQLELAVKDLIYLCRDREFKVNKDSPTFVRLKNICGGLIQADDYQGIRYRRRRHNYEKEIEESKSNP